MAALLAGATRLGRQLGAPSLSARHGRTRSRPHSTTARMAPRMDPGRARMAWMGTSMAHPCACAATELPVRSQRNSTAATPVAGRERGCVWQLEQRESEPDCCTHCFPLSSPRRHSHTTDNRAGALHLAPSAPARPSKRRRSPRDQ